MKFFKRKKKEEKKEPIVMIDSTDSGRTWVHTSTAYTDSTDNYEAAEVGYVCEHCGRVFSTKRGKSVHITRMHKDV